MGDVLGRDSSGEWEGGVVSLADGRSKCQRLEVKRKQKVVEKDGECKVKFNAMDVNHQQA